jgi:hypothetical protein
MARRSWKEVLDETVAKGSLAKAPADFEKRVEDARRGFASRTQANADIEKVSFPADGAVVLRVLVDAEDLAPSFFDESVGGPIEIPKLTVNGVAVNAAKARDPQRSETPGKVALTLTGSVATSAMPAVRSMPLSMSAQIAAGGPLFQGFKVVLPRS